MENNLDIDKAIIASQELEKEEKHWLEILGGDFNKSCLPYDFPFYDIKEIGYEFLEFQISKQTAGGINKLCGNSEMKLHFVLTTALFILIKKYTDENDISIGTSIYKQASDLDFVNTILVVRNVLDETSSIKELLLNIRDVMIKANQNQNYPLENIIKKLKIPYGINDYYPFFDIGLIIENIQSPNYLNNIKFNLLFSFLKNEDGSINCKIRYNPKLYRENSINNLFSYYSQILKSFLPNIDKPIKDIDCITETEKDVLLNKFNPKTESGTIKPVIGLIQEKFREVPEKIAIRHYGDEITYAGLEEKSNSLASYLSLREIKGRVVAIHLNPSIDLIVSIVGVLKAGGVFLLIDPSLPLQRKKYMLADSMAYFIISNINDDLNKNCNGETIDLKHALDCNKPFNPTETNLCENAYVIYTSGTTGQPKGTILNHRGLANYINWAANIYVKEEETNFPLFTSVSFDLTVTSIFTPLVSGNSINIYYGKEPLSLLKEILQDNKVGVLKLTPTHIKILNTIDPKSFGPGYKNHIKRLIIGGEQLNPQDVVELNKNFPNIVDIYNEYGPTETVVGSTIAKLDLGKIGFENIAIGKPIDNTQIYIMDSGLKLSPIGAIGEIYIGGHGVAKGYLNRQALTREKFIPNPFIEGERIYKTGDIGRWLPDGNIEFFGRQDAQVKIRGFRIEPGEIEHQLSTFGLIQESAVIVKEKDGDKYLAAYYVSKEDVETSQVRNFLLGKLPDYMIPSYFVCLKSLPLNQIGKLDRKALPDPEIEAGDNHIYVAPSNDVEKKLVEIWSEVLKFPKEKISVDKSFFELGGHSIRAINLMDKIQKDFLVQIELKDIFENTSIKNQYGLIANRDSKIVAPIKKLEKKEFYLASSAQERMLYEQMANKDNLTNNISRVYKIIGGLDINKLQHSFNLLINRHEGIRTCFLLEGKNIIQRIIDKVEFKLHLIDKDKYQSVKEAFDAFVYPFDLSNYPQMRCAIFQHKEQGNFLFVDIHHIVCDWISFNILMNDFQDIYIGNELMPLDLKYVDYAHWQKTKNKTLNKQKEFWEKQLAGELPRINLPVLQDRGMVDIYQAKELKINISGGQYQKIKDFASESDVSGYMFLLSVYFVLLSKIAGDFDIIVGTDVIGRTHPLLKRVVGTFINVLPLRMQLSEDMSFKEFLSETKQCVLEAFNNQDFQYDQMSSLTNLPAKQQIVDVYFSYTNFFENETNFIESEFTQVPIEKHTISTRYELELNVAETGDSFDLTFLYSVALYESDTIELFKTYYCNLVESIINDSLVALGDIELDDSGES